MSRGITSRYNEVGDPELLAFLVIDEEKAREEVKRAINLVEDVVLH